MKAGMSLMELAAKVEADVARQEDLIVDTRKLSVLATEDNAPTLHLPDGRELDLMHQTHRQIGQRVGIRADYYDRLRNSHPALYTQTVNALFREADPRFTPGPYMIRTYKDGGEDGRGVARAMLSDKFHRVDHHTILQAILPVLGELKDAGHEVRVDSAQVTDSKLYLKVVIPTISYDLNDYIDPSVHTKPNLPGTDGTNIVQCGLVFTNSEVGTAQFDVQKLLFKLSCTNGLIMGSLVSRRHIGKRLEAGEDMTIYEHDTLAADALALQLKVRDVTKAYVDELKFELLVQEFAAAASTKPMDSPIKAMETLAPVISLTGNELTKATEHLLKDGDFTKLGAVNAITRMAQDLESYDRSTDLEELAATSVLRMGAKDWEAIATAA